MYIVRYPTILSVTVCEAFVYAVTYSPLSFTLTSYSELVCSFTSKEAYQYSNTVFTTLAYCAEGLHFSALISA